MIGEVVIYKQLESVKAQMEKNSRNSLGQILENNYYFMWFSLAGRHAMFLFCLKLKNV